MKKATYVALDVHKKIEFNIFKMYQNKGIPNLERQYHTTLIYSKILDEIKVYPSKKYTAEAIKFDIFKHRGNNALVLILNSKSLQRRFKEIISTTNLESDFDEYIPHITLSYNVGDFDYSDLPIPNFSIYLEGEYTKELRCR